MICLREHLKRYARTVQSLIDRDAFQPRALLIYRYSAPCERVRDAHNCSLLLMIRPSTLVNQFLASDAVLGPGNRLQAFRADFLGAIEAIAKCSAVNPIHSGVHRSQQVFRLSLF